MKIKIAIRLFKEWNLNINKSKTEFVEVYIAEEHEKMEEMKSGVNVKRAELSRWNMLGHILRSDERSPAQVALCFVI